MTFKKMNGGVALINDALKSPNHKTYFGLVLTFKMPPKPV